MDRLSPFCTCSDHDCPHNPVNHGRGCSPCIAKNIAEREVPSCLWNLVDTDEGQPSYSIRAFAEKVLEKDYR